MRYSFGDYELDDQLYELRRNGAPVELERKVYDVLAYLIQHRERLVTKDELLDKLWPGQVVGEAALTRCITSARKVLGDDGERQEVIKTQYGRGYRFVAAVAALGPSPEARVLRQEEGASSQETEANQKAREPRTGTERKPRWIRPASRLAAVGLLCVVVALGANHYLPLFSPSFQSLPLPDKPSIIVLPFVNMSGDPEQEHLSDGLAEDLTTDLSKLSGLYVISRYSASLYKGKEVKVQDISRELGVRYVLEGSVRRTHEEVRVTAQLIDATTGHHLWSERYSRPLREILSLQDEIIRKIVVHLALRLTDIELDKLERTYPISIEAYEYQHRGMEHIYRYTRADTSQARQWCEKAIALEPTYAPAYSCASVTYWMEWVNQWTQDPQTLERALELGQKAIALDDSLPIAHEVVGNAYLWKRQYTQAIAELERAVALGPNWWSAYAMLGVALSSTGRAVEAIGVLEKALRFNPRHPIHTTNYLAILGQAYRLTGQYDEALLTLKKALGLFSRHPGVHVYLAIIYQELGRDAEAQAEVAEVLRINPQFSLGGLRQRLLNQDPAENERILAALRKAGLR